MNEIKHYILSNKNLNLLLILALTIIVSFQVSKGWPTLFGWNSEIVNYYYEVTVNLAAGFCVSTIFFIIVVYYPDRKKKKLVNVKTSIIFARFQTHLNNFINCTIESYNLPLSPNDDIKNDYLPKIENTDPIKVMSECINYDPIYNNDTMLKKAIHSSSEIEKLKKNIIPFLLYLENNELAFYAELENILIFENMDKLDRWPPKDQLLIDELPHIIKTYYLCQKIVGGNSNKIEWEPEYRN